MKKFFITLLLTIIIASGAGIVKAYQVNVDGGTWNYVFQVNMYGLIITMERKHIIRV